MGPQTHLTLSTWYELQHRKFIRRPEKPPRFTSMQWTQWTDELIDSVYKKAGTVAPLGNWLTDGRRA